MHWKNLYCIPNFLNKVIKLKLLVISLFLLQFAAKFKLPITAVDIWNFFESTIVPQGVNAFQVPQEQSNDTTLVSALSYAREILPKKEVGPLLHH